MLRRHGNTTFTPPLLSQSLRSGAGNSGDGEGAKALTFLDGSSKSFGFCISQRDGGMMSNEAERYPNNDDGGGEI